MPLNPHPRAEQADIAHRLAQFAPRTDAGAVPAEPAVPIAAATDAAAALPVHDETPGAAPRDGWRARLLSLPVLGSLVRFARAVQMLGSFRTETLARLAALEAHAAAMDLRAGEDRHLLTAQRADTAALHAYVVALHADCEALAVLARKTAAEQQALARERAGDPVTRPEHD